MLTTRAAIARSAVNRSWPFMPVRGGVARGAGRTAGAGAASSPRHLAGRAAAGDPAEGEGVGDVEPAVLAPAVGRAHVARRVEARDHLTVGVEHLRPGVAP